MLKEKVPSQLTFQLKEDYPRQPDVIKQAL